MNKQMNATVIGGGSFGTAIANILADNDYNVCMWMRSAENADTINQTHFNHRYLPDVKLNPNIKATTNLKSALHQAELVFFCVPSKVFRKMVRQAAPYLLEGAMLVSTTKGVEPDSFLLMSEILQEETGSRRVGVLNGPNIASEIGARKVAGTVIASRDAQIRQALQVGLSCQYLRVYGNPDVYGVELAGTLKNIYAIGAGMSAALEMGSNTLAFLITRGLGEMSRFAVAMGANPMTFLGLAGVGDLVVTCTSKKSRNYRFGYAIGLGEPMEEALERLDITVEGVETCRSVKHKADEMGLYMPLVSGLYRVLFEHASQGEVLEQLMSGAGRNDVEFGLYG